MILSLDPSGNFNEGKGISGWVMLDEKTGKIAKFGAIDASISLSIEEHWQKHINLIEGAYDVYGPENITIVIEDYLLYASKASTQINSRLETPKLIGVIQMYCHQKKIPLHFQTAVSVQRRWKDFLLEKKGFITIKDYPKNGRINKFIYIGEFKVNNHVVDALRHAVHYYTFHGKDM